MGDKYGNGRILESIMQQPQPQMVSAPLNDIQLIALMAAGMTSLAPADAVTRAGEILIEAVKQHKALATAGRAEAMKG